MIRPYVINDQKYRAYAMQICGDNNLKDDLVQEMYVRLDGILKKHPEKQINDRFIFLMIRSIFIDGIRKEREVYLNDMELIEPTGLDTQARIMVDDVLEELNSFDRRLLLATHEESLRDIAEIVGCHHQTINNYKQEALKQFKIKWQNKYGNEENPLV